jgi:valyl-tRNA synthetase
MLEKTYTPKDIEDKHYQRWEKANAFKTQIDPQKPPFCIMMPPPNVTGSLHMGHALTYTLQDVCVRYMRMRGYDILWQAGTDHAGIATQMVVERQLKEQGLDRRKLGREAFLEKVWEWKDHSGGTILKQQRRLGLSTDWSRQRFTMDEGLSKAVIKVFVQLYHDGLIYRDKRLVNWDPKLLTAVSDLEVKNTETKGNLWFIKYPIANEKDQYITVATTRPETMFGDTAVAVHPKDKRYKHLIGKEALLPFVNRPIPIISDDAVDQEKGTGAVKITPAHDFNDFEMGKRHNLPMISIMDTHAHLTTDLPKPFAGLERFAARKLVVEELEKMELLEKIEPTIHAVPHGDRSGVVLEPRLTDQWFMDVEALAKGALKAVDQSDTTIVPENWKHTYDHWLNNIQPWCISRQLWWGHRIHAWYGPDQKIFVAETESEAYEQAEQHYGKKVELKQDEDVLDTWFSSGLWPFSTLGWPEKTPELTRYYPNALLITGTDILFFWVARMMMMGLYVMKQVPFKTVYLHALVRDQHGQKMSKTKGNVIDPLEVMDTYGADALRFTMTALASPGRDVKYSNQIVEGYRNFATKLWNAARYCEFNQASFNKDYDPSQCQSPVNQWIIDELVNLTQTVDESFTQYRFDDVAAALYQFTWGKFCDWYVEFTKPLLQDGNAEIKQETQNTLAWVLGKLCHLLHPIIPFITEEIWSHLNPQGQALISEPWPQFDKSLSYPQASHDINWIIELITRVRSVRREINIPGGAMIDLWVTDDKPETRNKITQYEGLIKRLARLQNIEIGNNFDASKGVAQFIVEGTVVMIPLGELIDIGAEKDRLQKSLEKAESEITALSKKLENEEFIKNAPEDIIAKNQERFKEATELKQKCEEALSFLG